MTDERDTTRNHTRFMTKAELAECFHRDERTITDDEYRQARLATVAYFEQEASA